MAFYIKVTKEVADRLHLTDIRNRTADGNVLLWQADVARFPGDTVFDRAKEAGGICLTPQAAKEEIDGTDHPVVTRNFAASLFRNIKYFTLRKLYLCRKWMQKRLQKTTTTGITLPNFDFLA